MTDDDIIATLATLIQGTNAEAHDFLAALRAAGYDIVPTDDDRHVIQFTDNGWTIAHPIRERIDLESLFACDMGWDDDDPGVRGRFVLHADGTIGEAIR